MKKCAQSIYWTNRQNVSLGFTLVELLVVIAILGILGGLVGGGALNMKAKAKATGCIANLRTIGMAHYSYMQDHKGKIVYSFNPGLPTTDPNRYWWTALRQYATEDTAVSLKGGGRFARMLVCPADETSGTGIEAPDPEEIHWKAHSYKFNIRTEGKSFYSIQDPSAQILAGEIRWWDGGVTQYIGPQSNRIKRMPDDWHEQGVHILFLDGRVEAINKQDLFSGGDRHEQWFINGQTVMVH